MEPGLTHLTGADLMCGVTCQLQALKQVGPVPTWPEGLQGPAPRSRAVQVFGRGVSHAPCRNPPTVSGLQGKPLGGAGPRRPSGCGRAL